jgi:flagellar motor protein MotB
VKIISAFPETKPELDSQIMRPSPQSDSWIMSYSDLVTVLLCFFILFFVMKSRQQEENFINEKKSSGLQELILSDVTAQLKSSTLTSKAEIAKYERHIAVNAKNIFFKEGTNKFNLEGEYFFAELALKLFKFMPDLQIQMSLGVNSFQSTESGSIERMNVMREYLIHLGIDPELITIGTHKSEINESDEKLEEIRVFISKNYRKSST